MGSSLLECLYDVCCLVKEAHSSKKKKKLKCCLDGQVVNARVFFGGWGNFFKMYDM